jgi:putative ABC transport system ATP-binding protein
MTMHQANIARPVSAPDIVTMSGVRFAWPGGDGFQLSIDTFALHYGERLLLVGPSGGGKSTFLSLLAGIVTPQAGSISILGTDIAAMRGAVRDRFRAEHFGIIFQMFNLLPYLSILDNVLLPLRFAKGRHGRVASAGTPEAEARRLLASLGLDVNVFAHQPAAALSVGQQQRVAAARALIGAPEVVVADEPTSALDRGLQRAFLDLLFDDLAQAGASLVMVSHDESLAARFDRVLALADVAQATGDAA